MKQLMILLLLLYGVSAAAYDRSDLFSGKNIVVLGGTGYLGRAIIAEILKYDPTRVIVFSRDEVKHFNCEKIFGNDPRLVMVIGDIRDYNSVCTVTRDADIVFHVAALKRMDTLETNVQEAIKTNVIASINIFNACVENNVDKVLFVSTDKASMPINAYGACKFVSEKIFTNYDKERIKTKFVVTRFGNILESTGSVIPIFTQKIKDGDPITLTDERMTRFIIEKNQAAQLMCDALIYGDGGEIFTKRLPALRVIDLISVLKTHYNAANEVKVIGLRPGEKLHEVLLNSSELKRTYEYKGYLIVRPSIIDLQNKSTYLPDYVKNGTYLGDNPTDYSSDLEVLSEQDLMALFNKLGIFTIIEGRLDEKINI